MGLLQNGYRHNLTGRIVGATNLDGANPYARVYTGHRTAAQRNQFAGPGITSPIASVPSGHRPPSAWIMARRNGAMSSRNDAGLSVSAQAQGWMGLPAQGSASISVTVADATGQLIASGQGSASFVISTNAPVLTASINGAGTASWSVSTNSPVLGALASVIGTASFSFSTNAPTIYPLNDASPLRTGSAGMSFSGSLVPYAKGYMSGSTADNSVLTGDAIASAVWSRVIEAGYSAEQIIRIVAAHAAGSATGLEGVNPQFTGLDGATVRIDGSYAAGTRTIDSLNGA